ncbi:hypothetical protein [Occallatibacter savannae]|uniref:hypothetical protein n=1 Tax=Occallatibacter savannae TaxID=1002691 RepID=UPI000D68C89E|nr:hypothetical protein [Occallatibacter savannae]
MKLRGAIKQSDLVAITAFSLLFPILELTTRGLYWQRVEGWLDNGSYIEIANVIRFGGPTAEQHFWGLPAVIALLERLFSVSGYAAIIAVSLAGSIVATFLVYRLYGAAVTAAFIILSPEWVRLSILGGSEPLFMALLLCAWLLFRRDQALLAVTVASLASIVRPLGVIAVCAFGLVLLMRWELRRLAIVIGCSALIALGYFAWVRHTSGDPFINFKLYTSVDWPSGNPVSFPFVRLITSFIRISRDGYWTRLVQPLFCLMLVSLSIFFAPKHAFAVIRRFPAELTFVIGYLCFIVCWNYNDLARFLPRLTIPIYPFLLFSVQDRLPTNPYLLWLLVIISALIASVDLVGFKAVLGFGLHN